MFKVLIADDHAIVRRGLKNIILEEFQTAEIVEVGDADSLVKEVMKSTWDLVITDLSMPGGTGLQALQQIKLHSPKTPVLILSIYPEEQYALRALKAGAAGYLNKDMAPNQLVDAIQRVLAGRRYITETIAEKLASGLGTRNGGPFHQQLSDREFEVLKLLAAGKSVSEIGAQLQLSVTTVSTYRTRVLSKLNLKTNADLTLYAIENNLL